MDEVGVDRVVLVQPYSAYRYDSRYTADSAARYPDRFASVCTVDLHDPDVIERVRHWVVDRGARGIRLRHRQGCRHLCVVFGRCSRRGLRRGQPSPGGGQLRLSLSERRIGLRQLGGGLAQLLLQVGDLGVGGTLLIPGISSRRRGQKHGREGQHDETGGASPQAWAAAGG